MTHIFIEEQEAGAWKVTFGDLVIHVEEYKQAAELALMIAQKLGLIGY